MGNMNEAKHALGQLPQHTQAIAKVCALREWLTEQALCIPHYQRPYKWGLRQVQQLLSDIEQQTHATLHEQGASSYRMGTVVVHMEQQASKQWHNIVDGQQRTVTLLLVLHALRALTATPGAVSDAGVDVEVAQAQGQPAPPAPAWQQRLLQLALYEPAFSSALSQEQVRLNYQTIARHVRQAQWGEAQVLFLLDRCEVVRVELHSLTEAFQFFDAQNGRGKDLCVHDLLKAFHLRALRPAEMAQRGAAVQAWEQCSQADLERLFARFLFQTRQRSRGRNAEFFRKGHVEVFKGISLDAGASAPMTQTWRLLDDAVHMLESHTGLRSEIWPCQLDAPVVNGLRFFDWVRHYWGMGFHLKQMPGQLPPWTRRLKQPLDADARELLVDLGRYPGHGRKGDGHVRAVFDALLMYYLDKFGEQGLAQAVRHAFVWVYARLLHRRVMEGSMDKFVNECPVNLFVALRDAVTPQQFFNVSLPTASFKDPASRSKSMNELRQWMDKLGYWENAATEDANDQT